MSAPELEVQALLRLSAARDELDAVLGGHVAADADTVSAIADLVEAGAQRLRWANASRSAA